MSIKQPEDKSQFILPDLGEGVHEAELIKWRVKPGDQVDEHQILAEMETDKALVEVPSPWAGVIKALHGKEGDILNVGTALVSYDTGAADGAASVSSEAQEAAQTAAAEEEREDAGTVVGSVSGGLSVSERFLRRRETEPVSAASGRALATPAMRRLAREAGVDINRIHGTGRGGRVTASDVETFVTGATPAPAPAPAAPTALPTPTAPTISGDGVAERIPIRGVRRKIAESLQRSIQSTAHFTVVDEADVTALERKRREYSSVIGRKFSLLPFVMTAVCRALRVHPSLNANVDDAGGQILIRSAINLGCAVDTEHGLMVPVVESADTLTIVELGEAVADLARQCHDRSIPREKLVGGSFTISNVGAYGGIFSTPIINYPEVAILGTGRARERVLTRDGMFYAGVVLPLSLSCDHRIVDGAEGARFLNTVVGLLESPESLVNDS